MPESDKQDRWEEHHAMDDPISQSRGFLPYWLTRIVVPIIFGCLILTFLYLIFK